MDNKKLFRLDMSIAVEASDANEAYEVLITKETLVQIQKLIVDSKDTITEMFDNDVEEQPTIIN